MCDEKDSYISLSTMVSKIGRLVDILNNLISVIELKKRVAK